MPVVSQAQKASQFGYFIENLDTETVVLKVFGKEIVEAAINHIGHNNFFRAHRNLRVNNNYRSIPALRDGSKAGVFFESNIEVIREAFTKHAINVGGLSGADVLISNINKGTLKDAPYSMEVLQDFVKKDLSDNNLSETDQEIQDWFDKKVVWLNNSLIAQQSCLAIEGVTKEHYDFMVAYAALIKGKRLGGTYQAYCLALLKTIVFMAGDTFSAYLDREAAQQQP